MVLTNIINLLYSNINYSIKNLFFIKKKKINYTNNMFKSLYFLQKIDNNFFLIKKNFLLETNKVVIILLTLSSIKTNQDIKYINKKINKFYNNIKGEYYRNINAIGLNKIFQVISFLKNNFKDKVEKVNFQFIRKFRVFNKGRYSRNRQFYRTGVYWCLYIHIIAVTGIYFWFYKITINFNYLWIFFYLFFFLFIWSRIVNIFSKEKIKTIINWNLKLIMLCINQIICIFLNIKNNIKYFFLIQKGE